VTTAPRRFADTYVQVVNRGAYHELAALFAPDAVFLAPAGQEFHGRDEIGAFYQKFLATITPKIRIASYVEQDNHCVYELEAAINGSDEYHLGAIDHAVLDENGLATRFTVFTK
jgi:hypothetical protein